MSRQAAAFDRHEDSFAELFRGTDERDAATAERDAERGRRDAERDRRDAEQDRIAAERHEASMNEHRRVLDRFARSEDRVVEALGDMHLEVARNTSRIDDMGAAIRANTQAVLSMLDRMGPATG